MPNAPSTYRATQQQRRPRLQQARKSTAERGYAGDWPEQSKAFIQEYPFCVGCDPTEELKYRQSSGDFESFMNLLQLHSTEMTHAAGCDGLSKHTDHSEPVINGQEDPEFWNREKWRPRSAECHSRKTATHDRGFGR